MVKNSQKAKKTSVTSERVPISSKPSNLDCRDSGESFDAHIVAVCKIFEKGRGFCRAPCLAVGLLYTCILQGARQAQGPCCTNPNLWPNQWSHKVPAGTKWNIWTWSFCRYPLVYCRSSGLDTTASQSQAFFQKSQKCWKLTNFAQSWKSIFGSIFFKRLLF